MTSAAAIELTDELDARETVTVAASLAAIALGVAYWVLRIGFSNPVAPVATAVGVSLFILASPLWIMRLTRWRSIGAGEWWTSQPPVMLLMFALTAIFGMLSRASGVPLGLVLGVPGAACFLATLFFWLRRGRVVATVLFIIGTVWFVLWAGGVVWGSRYKMPLYWERFALDGNLHHDPLYYTSMANMLDVYGVPSTGIDGLSLIKYHYGSAWLFGKLAHLIGTDVLTFYSLGYPIIILPLFLAAILLLAVEIRRSAEPEAERPLRADFRVWAVFAVAAISIFPVKAAFGLAIWNGNTLLSESYLTGLPVFLLTIAAAVAFYRTNAYQALVASAGVGANDERQQNDPSAVVFLLGFLPLVVVCLGFLKVSLMLLLLPMAIYTAFRLRIWNRGVTAMALGVCIVVTALTYPVVSLSSQNGGVSPFSFMRYNVADGWQQFFPLLNLMWTWIYIAVRLWEERIVNTRELTAAFHQQKILDAEVVSLVALLGFLPGEIISIHGGSAVYFSDVQRWVALAFIVARIGTWTRKWKAIREARALRLPSGWRGVQLSTVAAVFVAIPFAITVLLNSVYWPVKALRSNESLRMAIATKGGGGLITDPEPLSRGFRKSEFYSIETALRRVGSLPVSTRRRSALFIPQSYERYWRMFDADQRCTFVPFVAPAIAGVVVIDGMPPRGCAVTDQYNFSSYTRRTRDQSPQDVSTEALCRRASVLAVSQIFVMSPDASGNARLSRVGCKG